jgi:hypothetical protein
MGGPQGLKGRPVLRQGRAAAAGIVATPPGPDHFCFSVFWPLCEYGVLGKPVGRLLRSCFLADNARTHMPSDKLSGKAVAAEAELLQEGKRRPKARKQERKRRPTLCA